MSISSKIVALILACLVGGFAPGVLSVDPEDWQLIPVPGRWESVFGQHDGFVWLKAYVVLPSRWAGQELIFHAGRIDDADETFFNGSKVGGVGKLPPEPKSAWNVDRIYTIPGELVREGANLICIRIYDTGGAGGITSGTVSLEGPTGSIDLAGGTWLARKGDDLSWKDWSVPSDSLQATLLARKYLATQGSGAIAPGGGIVVSEHTQRPSGDQLIWYRSPAGNNWTRGLPLGNGRLGTMVLGGPRHWKLQLNEDGIWAGTPTDRVRHGAHQYLDEARKLIFDGEVVEAQKLLQKQFMSPRWTRSYQTLADLDVHQSGLN
ncbi:MAG: glycoside hydrolase N-terminal domain-containing protein, partial [Planctomycetota bacterium]